MKPNPWQTDFHFQQFKKYLQEYLPHCLYPIIERKTSVDTCISRNHVNICGNEQAPSPSGKNKKQIKEYRLKKWITTNNNITECTIKKPRVHINLYYHEVSDHVVFH